jgi:acylaminoacyl-peptidase
MQQIDCNIEISCFSHLLATVSSSPIDPPHISYGRRVTPEGQALRLTWDEVDSPMVTASSKVSFSDVLRLVIISATVSTNSPISHCLLLQVKSLLLHHSVTILQIPVANPSDDLSNGIILKTRDVVC